MRVGVGGRGGGGISGGLENSLKCNSRGCGKCRTTLQTNKKNLLSN